MTLQLSGRYYNYCHVTKGWDEKAGAMVSLPELGKLPRQVLLWVGKKYAPTPIYGSDLDTNKSPWAVYELDDITDKHPVYKYKFMVSRRLPKSYTRMVQFVF